MDFSNDTPPALPVVIDHQARRKSATARVDGGVITVTLPKSWPKAYKLEVVRELSGRVQQQFRRDWELAQQDHGPEVTFTRKKELVDWINRINTETLNLPFNGIRWGSSKYTRLAQMNIASRVMTVSKFCTDRVPESALRYLIIHELAHLLIPNHSRAFWDLVKRYVPDLNRQKRLIAAVHRIRVYEAEQTVGPKDPPAKLTPPSDIQQTTPAQRPSLKQLLLNLLP